MYRFGVDYYPEHWPEERWPIDAKLMQEAGINVVRLVEFAWAQMEPRANRFDFAWLDRALDILLQHGIQVILGTPTASAPPWVMEMYPDAFKLMASGLRQTYGNRVNHCQTHLGFRERGQIITRAMAEHYKDHPAVIGWQTDNEFGSTCCCQTCRMNFQAWLRRRYGTLERLNEAWGTAFWSHIYREWEQIPVPLETGGVPNPGLALDFARFTSDVNVAFQQEHVDILREVCPKHFVTHNLMGYNAETVNYFDLAKPLDFVAWDNYPRGFWNVQSKVDPAASALGHAAMRGVKNQPFWLMEEQSGAGGWHYQAVNPRPGEIRLWTYQSIAHGADGMIYFRWRTARYGTEQYWHGVLDHHAQPRRRYAEVKEIGAELSKVGRRFLGAETRSQVALVMDYDTRWAWRIQPHHQDFKFQAYFGSWFKAFHARNISVDIAAPKADLDKYRLVVAPAMYVMTEAAAANLAGFVERGGTLLITARTGVKDEANAVVNQPLPGLLSQAAGVEVDEYDVIPTGETMPLKLDIPGAPPVSAKWWVDVLTPTTAEVLGTYAGPYYAGRAAVTVNRFGKGRVVYVGAFGDFDLHSLIAGWAAEQAGVSPLLATPLDVEAVARWHGERKLLFLLNHSDAVQEVALDGVYEDLLAGGKVQGSVSLAPKGVLVLEG